MDQNISKYSISKWFINTNKQLPQWKLHGSLLRFASFHGFTLRQEEQLQGLHVAGAAAQSHLSATQQMVARNLPYVSPTLFNS